MIGAYVQAHVYMVQTGNLGGKGEKAARNLLRVSASWFGSFI